MNDSADDDLVAIVFGASGAIGGAFVEALSKDGRFGQVHACARSRLESLPEHVVAHHCDITREADVTAVAAEVGGPIDLVVVASGILHRENDIFPEKSMGDIDPGRMAEVFRINTFGPAITAKHFLPLLRKKRRSVFATLSARVGSIGDNRLGGWVSYRSSKAALNMVLRTLSIEQARKNRDSIVVGLHPGTVDSELSAPFRSGVPEDKLFSPDYSAGRLLQVLDGLTPEDSGYLYAYDGSRIEF